MHGTTLVTINDLGEQGTPASRTRHPDRRPLPAPTGSNRTRGYRRVLLINPPATLHKADFPRCTYPLGIGYLAAMLTLHGYEVRLLDAFAKGYDRARPNDSDPDFYTYGISMDEIEEEVRLFAPDVVGVSSIFSNQVDNVVGALRAARTAAPDAAIVVGGAHVRYFPRHYLRDGLADAAFTSEAEATLIDFLGYLNDESPESALTGLSLRRRSDGRYFDFPEAALVTGKREARGAELDDIPFPQWDLYDMERYFSLRAYQSPYTVGSRIGQIYTTRGCSAKCTFCTTTNFWGGRVRRRSPENVCAELEQLKRRYSIDEFHIQDDNVTNDMEYGKRLFRSFLDVGLPWATPAGTALWRMDAELLELMAKSGAYQVTFAIESGSQRVLDQLVRKPLDLRKTKSLIQMARDVGLHVHGFFIIGMPPMFGYEGETVDEMWQSFRFAQEAGFDSASFFTATPIVGSVLLEECRRQGFIPPELELFRMSYKQGVISVPGLWRGAEVAELAAQFNRSMNSKPRAYRAIRSWHAGQY